jgi:hypothetical protein
MSGPFHCSFPQTDFYAFQIAFDEWQYSFTGGMLAGVPLQGMQAFVVVAPNGVKLTHVS